MRPPTIDAAMLVQAPSGGRVAGNVGGNRPIFRFLPLGRVRGGKYSGGRGIAAVAGHLRSYDAKSGGLTRYVRSEKSALWAFLWITRFADALAVKSPIIFFPSRAPVTPPCGQRAGFCRLRAPKPAERPEQNPNAAPWFVCSRTPAMRRRSDSTPAGNRSAPSLGTRFPAWFATRCRPVRWI